MEPTKKQYVSPYVEERFFKKPLPKFNIGEILRIEHIVKNPDQYYDKEGIVAGWSRTLREAGGGKLIFIELNDGSSGTSLQVVVEKGATPEESIPNFEEIAKAGLGASFRIRGKLVKSPAKGQVIEVQVKDPKEHYVKVLGTNQDTKAYPLSKKGHTLEFLREIAHLRPRSKYISAMTRVRNSLAMATHLFFQSRGFLLISTPIITASDCEGAGEMFQVTTVLPEPKESIKSIPLVDKKDIIDYNKDFFKRPSYLTVSGQLSIECYACAMCNVYNFNPAFRAENSHTARHLSEFWMIEPEMAFADIHDNMELAEHYVRFCLQYVLENNREDLEYFEAEQIRRAKEEKKEPPEVKLIDNLSHVMNSDFKRVSYTEAVEICLRDEKDGKVKFENKLAWGVDMNSEHERYLAEKVFKGPVIVYNHPKEFKAFYMLLNEDGKTVASMDVLVPGVGELIGGAQREHRYDVLDKKIEDMGLDKSTLWWYTELRKYGTVPHAGFGLGFERLIMFVTGIENIRDVIPFPRTPGHAEF